MHAGGIVGAPAPARMVPALAFAGAPRMHSGGAVGLRHDEVPAILQRGERVLSRREAQGYGAGGVNITIMARDAESFRQSRTQVAADIARGLAGAQGALMAFHEARFPDDISRGARGGPERRTQIVELASGDEERKARAQRGQGQPPWQITPGGTHRSSPACPPCFDGNLDGMQASGVDLREAVMKHTRWLRPMSSSPLASQVHVDQLGDHVARHRALRTHGLDLVLQIAN